MRVNLIARVVVAELSVLLDTHSADRTEDVPDLAIGDGALGGWNALREVLGTTKKQRCWFHKTGNARNRLPKSAQAKAKSHLHAIRQAEIRVDAETAFDVSVTTCGVQQDEAVGKLAQDRDVLLAFRDFPAENCRHIRTAHPMESALATVRYRTGKARRYLSRKSGLAMPSG